MIQQVCTGSPWKTSPPSQKINSIAQLMVPSESKQNSGKQKVDELIISCALCEAQIAAALEECICSHFNGVIPIEKTSTKLGLMVTILATVNGIKADSLVDTGSPATVLSLKFP